jgi:RNA polymerase sigma factor (sigma-70 family)
MGRCSEEDLALITLMIAGDRHAGEAFDRRFRPFVTRFVRGRVRPEDEPDLVQEVLMTAFKQICASKFAGASGLGTWIIGILKNKIADLWELKRKEERIFEPFKDAPLAHSALDAIPDTNQQSPEIAIEVEQLLATLPKVHRVILILKIREGWKTAEIATAMNLPDGTVSRLIWEAKRMLQELRPPLKELAPFGDQ